jgi:mono/diheme cytochrome c family protein
MRRGLGPVLGVALATSLTACSSHEFEPPDRGERVREAAAHFAPALFDTITWGAPDQRSQVGNQVYIDKCRTCHGPLGEGQTDYARGQGLEVPSLVGAGWALADPDSLHRVIYVGHVQGMPIFGDGAITPREIDAVAGYILDVLRPDVLGGAQP